ncbi:hypothetical protein BH18ACT4_BH18ACT4_15800 [soil metagenome]
MRLARASEEALYGLRTRAFNHIHRLSLAYHTDEHRGALVSRVTSDVETLSRCGAWGGVDGIGNGAISAAVTGTMMVYDWRLALIALVTSVPLASSCEPCRVACWPPGTSCAPGSARCSRPCPKR